MTYNVFGGTLNITQSSPISALAEFCNNAFLAILKCILFAYFISSLLQSDIVYK